MPQEPGGILVDASVWIKFFRSAHAPESADLDDLLEMRAVQTCWPVRVEVISGAKSEHERSKLRDLFLAIPLLEFPVDIWDRLEEARFRLARKGHQVSLVDLLIACTASFHGIPLWTLDKDFTVIREVISFSMYLPSD